MTKETVGKISSDLIVKQVDDTHSATDQMREQLNEWDKNIMECINRGKKDFLHDFYIVVLTKKERLMPNVLRNYFTCRISCPTPEWDQSVFHYERSSEKLTFLWVVPAKDVCEFFTINALKIEGEDRQLLKYVLEFNDGTLLKKAKQLNGEFELSPVL
jgi:hypothetical protein